MKAVFKRFLAIAMVFVLVLGFMPANIAFADGTIYVKEIPTKDPKTTGESHIIVTDENGRESLPCH